MSTVSYVKGLPTPLNELNAIGQTTFSMFLYDYSQVFYRASCETVNHLLSCDSFKQSAWNTYLQNKFNINKRHANGVIKSALGRIKSARIGRVEHLKILKSQLASAKAWLKKSERKLKSCQKFYDKKNWRKSKTGPLLALSCHLKYKNTNYQHLKFQVHHKKRRIYLLTKKIEHLKTKPIKVKIPQWDSLIVGSSDETLGNQVCQWDGNKIRFRVPECLKSKYSKYVETALGGFKRTINRIPVKGAKTWHFYLKDGAWKVALQFTPEPVTKVSRSINYGCIGIDLNPGSVDWAYVDSDGNLKQQGQITTEKGLSTGKQQAQIVDTCLKLVHLAIKYQCPIVVEKLDFSSKKAQLKEKGRKYARMLSGWAYAEFFNQLTSICANRGIYLKTVNPSYSSLIGLVKYCRQYGISSGVAAAIVIARRGMYLSERLPKSLKTCSITAYLDVKSGKHVWNKWSKLNKSIKSCTEVTNRHSYYSISNWDFLVKP
jgi:IS605 OrfB family transposase